MPFNTDPLLSTSLDPFNPQDEDTGVDPLLTAGPDAPLDASVGVAVAEAPQEEPTLEAPVPEPDPEPEPEPEPEEDESFFDLADIPKGIGAGVEAFGRDALGFFDFIGEAVGVPEDAFTISQKTAIKVDSTTGKLLKELVNFGLGFIPVVGAVGKLGTAAKLGQKATKLLRTVNVGEKTIATGVKWGGRLAKDTIAGAAVDFSFYDEQEERLSTILAEVPGVSAVIPDFMAEVDSEDEFGERLKAALEGSILGVAFDSVFLGVKGLRAMRKAKAAGGTPEQLRKIHAEAEEAVADAYFPNRHEVTTRDPVAMPEKERREFFGDTSPSADELPVRAPSRKEDSLLPDYQNLGESESAALDAHIAEALGDDVGLRIRLRAEGPDYANEVAEAAETALTRGKLEDGELSSLLEKAVDRDEAAKAALEESLNAGRLALAARFGGIRDLIKLGLDGKLSAKELYDAGLTADEAEALFKEIDALGSPGAHLEAMARDAEWTPPQKGVPDFETKVAKFEAGHYGVSTPLGEFRVRKVEGRWTATSPGKEQTETVYKSYKEALAAVNEEVDKARLSGEIRAKTDAPHPLEGIVKHAKSIVSGIDSAAKRRFGDERGAQLLAEGEVPDGPVTLNVLQELDKAAADPESAVGYLVRELPNADEPSVRTALATVNNIIHTGGKSRTYDEAVAVENILVDAVLNIDEGLHSPQQIEKIFHVMDSFYSDWDRTPQTWNERWQRMYDDYGDAIESGDPAVFQAKVRGTTGDPFTPRVQRKTGLERRSTMLAGRVILRGLDKRLRALLVVDPGTLNDEMLGEGVLLGHRVNDLRAAVNQFSTEAARDRDTVKQGFRDPEAQAIADQIAKENIGGEDPVAKAIREETEARAPRKETGTRTPREETEARALDEVEPTRKETGTRTPREETGTRTPREETEARTPRKETGTRTPATAKATPSAGGGPDAAPGKTGPNAAPELHIEKPHKPRQGPPETPIEARVEQGPPEAFVRPGREGTGGPKRVITNLDERVRPVNRDAELDRKLSKAAAREALEKFPKRSDAVDFLRKLRDVQITDEHVGAGFEQIAGLNGKTRWIDMFEQFRINALLSGPKTGAVNALGTAVSGMWRPIEVMLGSAFAGPHTKMAFRQGLKELVSFWQSLGYGWKLAKLSWKDGKVRVGHDVVDNRNARGAIAATGNPAFDNASDTTKNFVDGLGATISVPTRLLNATDQMFKAMAHRSSTIGNYAEDLITRGFDPEVAYARSEQLFRSQLRDDFAFSEESLYKEGLELARAKNIDPLLEEDIAKSHVRNRLKALGDEAAPFLKANQRGVEVADQIAFTEALPQKGIWSGPHHISNMAHHMYPVRFALPFVRTPSNLAFAAGSRFDFLSAGRWIYAKIRGKTEGFNESIEYRTRFLQDMASGDPARIAEAKGRLTTGAMAVASVMLAANTGRITGGGPADLKRRKEWMRTGWRPYSFRSADGESYYSYERLDPFASILGAAADLYEYESINAAPDDSEVEVVFQALQTAVMSNLDNKTYLAGLSDAMTALTDPEGSRIPKTIGSLAGTVIPSALNEIAKIDDPYVREARGFIDTLRARVPGFRKDLPLMRNIYGEPIYKPGTLADAVLPGAGGDIFGMGVPIAYSTVEGKLDEELLLLGRGFAPPAPRMQGIDLREIEFGNTNAYDRYQELAGTMEYRGQNLRSALEELLEDEQYINASHISDDNVLSPRIDAINRILRRYRRAAKRQLMKEVPEIPEAIRSNETIYRQRLIGVDTTL